MKKSTQRLEILSADDPSFRWVAIVLLVLVEVMLYSPGLVHWLAGYDYTFRDFSNRPLSSLWSTPTDDLGHWRPLAYSINHLLFSLFGETPVCWHLFNLLIHLVSVLLFFGILRKLSESFEMKGLTGSVLATFIFQVHPAAIQNVYWASGFSDLLCMLFLLLATYWSVAKIKNPRIHLTLLPSFSLIAALLSKESAIVFPVFLALILRLTQGSWQAVLKVHGRFLALLSLLAIAFGIAFVSVSGRMLGEQPDQIAGAPGVFARGLGMLLIPTDSMRIYQLADMSILAALGLAVMIAFVILLFLWKRILNLTHIALVLAAFLAGFAVYAVGGYISLRLMYGSIGFFTITVFLLLTRRIWWKERDVFTQVLRWSLVSYAAVTFLFAVSSVMDWHVADKFAKAMGDSFVVYHQDTRESRYMFGAIPVRLRQAEICGEPATDFRGILRRNEMPDSVEMQSLLRIVLLDRDDISANAVLLRTSRRTLIVSTQTENQFFLFGKVDTPHRLPIGTAFEDQGYAVEVLETILDDRAVTVRVTAKDPSDLDRLLFFDDQEKQFIPLQEIESASEDGPNE